MPDYGKSPKFVNLHHAVALERPVGALDRVTFQTLYVEGQRFFWASSGCVKIEVLSLYNFNPTKPGYRDIPSSCPPQFHDMECIRNADTHQFFTVRKHYPHSSTWKGWISLPGIMSYVDHNVLGEGELNHYNDHFIFGDEHTLLAHCNSLD